MLELSDCLCPLLVGKTVRVHVKVISDESVEIPYCIGLRTAVGQLYSFFKSASFVSESAPRTGTAEKK